MNTINLSQALFGNQGEALIESLDSDKKFCLGIFSNGLWEKRKTPVGEFTHQIHKMDIGYLKTPCLPSFKMTLPKIPAGIFIGIVAFFRKILQSVKSEVAVQIFWDTETQEYEVYVPIQQVAAASIKFERDKGPMINPKKVWVLDIHSHCNFGAFFSSVDTNDEKSTRLFGVIGQLGQNNPAHVWRAGCNNKYVELKFEDIWDAENLTEYVISDEVLANITEMKYTPPVVKYGEGYKGINHNRNGNVNAKNLHSNPSAHRNYMQRLASQHAAAEAELQGYAEIDDDMFPPIGNTHIQRVAYNPTSIPVSSDDEIEFCSNLVSAQNYNYAHAVDEFINGELKDWATNLYTFDNTDENALIEGFFDMVDRTDIDIVDFFKTTALLMTGYVKQNDWDKVKDYINGL